MGATRTAKSAISVMLASSILVSCTTKPYNKKPVTKDDVYVEVGQPRSWTLDEAHYLIAGLNRRARQLDIEGPGSLNPNAFNSSRLQATRTATNIQGQYDQAVGLNNALARDALDADQAQAQAAQSNVNTFTNQRSQQRRDLVQARTQVAERQAQSTAQSERLERLTARQSDVTNRLSTVRSEIENAEVGQDISRMRQEEQTLLAEEANLRTAISNQEDELGATNALLATARGREAALTESISQLDSDITSAEADTTVTPQTFTSTLPEDNQTSSSSSATSSEFATAVASSINSSLNPRGGFVPSFNVSDQLSNYIRAEYELISRQLTLLRSEAGPDKSVVFLQLPYSVHTARDTSDWRHVQLHWEIESFCYGDPIDDIVNRIEDVVRNDIEALRGDLEQKYSLKNQRERKIKQFKQTFASATENSISFGDNGLTEYAELLNSVFHRHEAIDPADFDAVIRSKPPGASQALSKASSSSVVFNHKAQKVYYEIKQLRSELLEELSESLVDAVLDWKTYIENADNQDQTGGTNNGSSASNDNGTKPNKAIENKNNDKKLSETTISSMDIQAELREFLQEDPTAELKHKDKARDHRKKIIRGLHDKYDKAFSDFRRQTTYVLEKEVREAIYEAGSYSNQLCKSATNEKVTDLAAVWEMTPSANAYNRADFLIKEKNFDVAGKIGLFFGLGLNASLERQKQIFEQFANQNVYASAYGQGNSSFGWVLGPRPGGKSVLPAAESTYAVLTLPKNATAVNFKAKTCILDNRRTALQNPGQNSESMLHHCFKTANEIKYKVPVRSNWRIWVDEVNYSQALAGDANTITIKGRDFSGFQVRILVDGHPIDQFDGTEDASRALAAVDATTLNAPRGYFEVTNSETIIVNLKMPSSYEGTPEITMVSPRRSVTLNTLPLKLALNGGKIGMMRNLELNPMFVQPLSFAQSPIVSHETVKGKGNHLVIKGTGFEQGMSVRYASKDAELKFLSKTRKEWNLVSTNAIRVKLDGKGPWTIVADKKVHGRTSSASITVPAKPATPTNIAIASLELLRITENKKSANNKTATFLVRGQRFPECITFEFITQKLAASLPEKAGNGKANKAENKKQPCTEGNSNKGQQANDKSSFGIKKVTSNEYILEATFDADMRDEILLIRETEGSRTARQRIAFPAPPILVTASHPDLEADLDISQIPAATRSLLACGRTAGGEQIIIRGRNLDQVSQIRFGTQTAQILWSNDSEMSVISPPSEPGRVVITASTDGANLLPSGQNSGGGLAFTYSATGCKLNRSKLAELVSRGQR